MEISIADQIALDDALVAPADRLKIGKCNLRLSSDVTSKEATLQVVYDVLKLTPFYKAFQVTADAPEIYMQEFWASAYVHNRSVRFKMNNKKHILGLDQFRDILQICPKVGNKKFEEPPLEKEILAFLASLGHSGDIRKITDVNVNKLHQPWRSFAAIINKCLSGKPSYDSLRLSQAQILWGMYNKKNVDYAYLLWEDFIFQIENKNTKKGNAMYYPRFTKLVVNFVMDKDPSFLEETRTIPLKTKGSKKKADTDTTLNQKIHKVPKNKETEVWKREQKAKELEIFRRDEDEGMVLHQGFDAPDYDQRMIALGYHVHATQEIETTHVTLTLIRLLMIFLDKHADATSLIDTPVTAIVEPSFSAPPIVLNTNPLVLQNTTTTNSDTGYHCKLISHKIFLTLLAVLALITDKALEDNLLGKLDKHQYAEHFSPFLASLTNI
ncbi:hypothetical protein Tco_0018313 [Tanacetum coccineum]